jgi:hypothetical protein
MRDECDGSRDRKREYEQVRSERDVEAEGKRESQVLTSDRCPAEPP